MLLFIWRRMISICFLSVAGSGIPGVGVAPGFTGFPMVFGSGMPGVGVDPGVAELTALTLFTGTTGLADSPGGKLFGSTF